MPPCVSEQIIIRLEQRPRFSFETVSDEEMRLLSAFLMELLKEVAMQAELEKE